MKRLEYQYVKDYFKNHSCTLLSKNYTNNSTKLEYVCDCGNTAWIRFSDFQNGKRCSKCMVEKIRKKQMFSKEYVFNQITNAGYNVLCNEYNGCKSKLKISCKMGHIICMTFDDFYVRHIKNRKLCRKCMIGPLHPNWNDKLTAFERERRRKPEDLRLRWIKDIHLKCEYKCQKCKGNGEIAHHLNGYHWDKVNRYNINNGVTLCKKCHKDFHSIYNNKNNTIQQYNEWNNSNLKLE